MNDRTLSKHHGKLFTVSEKIVGQGAYGCVYVGKDEYGQKIAIKTCPIKDDGIPNIFEASLMQSICHPYINSSIEVVASKDFLYIIQPLAVTDLYNYTNKLNYILSIAELKCIFFSLLQAVFILHTEGIIHCDIKASNVLLYEDGSVKLTDFTLSTIKMDHLYAHTVCTATHRDLAIHLKTGWDEKIDLWSLGCTFYEMTYNQLLFKNQSLNKEEEKANLKFKFINSIIDWAVLTQQKCDLKHYSVEYTPLTLASRIHDPECIPINTIINSLLMINVNQRPSLPSLLKDLFFEGMVPIPYKVINVSQNEINVTEEARVIRYIQQCTNDKDAQKLALTIYSKIDLDLLEHPKAIGCTFVALKILFGTHASLYHLLPVDQLLSIERDICHDLHFRLY